MKTFKDVPDSLLLRLWGMSEFTYETIADQLYHWGYDSTTPHKVRRRLKKVLRKQKLIPARPTLADYKKSRLKIRRLGGDELQ